MEGLSNKIELFSDDIPEKEKEKDDEVITAEECLRPRSPVLQDNVPIGHSDTAISKWAKSFPTITREAAVKLIPVIRKMPIFRKAVCKNHVSSMISIWN